MSLGRRVHRVVLGAATLVLAGSAALLTAPGASAAPAQASGLSMSVDITSQALAGSVCEWGVTFNMTITNSTGGPVTITSVAAPSYQQQGGPLHGAPAPGTVLQPGPSTFTNILSDSGPILGQPCGPEYPAPAPLVLTVDTSSGPVTWNQSVSDPQVVTEPQPPGLNYMAGSFDVADCAKYYFQYGTTTALGGRADVTTHCANDGTMTQDVDYTPASLSPGTGYYYRLVVIETDGTALYGQEQGFRLSGTGTSAPVGAVGGLGVAALAGVALFVAQRRRRNRHAAGFP